MLGALSPVDTVADVVRTFKARLSCQIVPGVRASHVVVATLVIIAMPWSILHAQSVTDPRLLVETATSTSVAVPTAMAFIGPGDVLICELFTGRVRRVINGIVQAGNVLDLSVATTPERGLYGMTLHPDFPNNGFIYLYYARAATDGGTWIENRVARFTWNGTALTGETLIIAFPFDAAQNNGPIHDGGIITFGPDGKLYGITGDLNRARFEQNVTNETSVAGVGGIFRLNDDGTIPPDNPFIAQAAPELQRLFAYGIRNSFGIAFDPIAANLWETDNGPTDYDEINLVPPGMNGGWNKIMGPDGRDTQNQSDLFFIPNAAYSDPEYSWAAPIAVTSIIFPADSALPFDLKRSCFVGDNNNGFLYSFTLNRARDAFVLTGGNADLVADNAAERDAHRFGQDFGAVTDLEVGPDGWLYAVGLDSGRVFRIRSCKPCPEDISPFPCGNGQVNIDDFTKVILNWNTPNVNVDIDGDGVVNINDYTAIVLNWGPCD